MECPAPRLLDSARKGMHLLLFQGGGPDGLCPRTMAHLWKTLGRPLLEYGCEIWHGEVSAQLCKRLETVQNSFCRAILGLKSFPAASAMRAEVGVGSLHSRRQLLKALYWKKLCALSSDRLVSLIFRRRHAEVLAGHGALSCLNSFKTCLDELDLSAAWADATADDWDSVVRAQVRAKELRQQTALQLACRSLTLYTALDHSYSHGAHSYLLDRGNLPGTRLKTHLRLGILWTMSRVASVAKWPASGGCCLLCRSGATEDAEHFLLLCPSLSCHRDQFRRSLTVALPCLGVATRAVLDLFVAAAPAQALSMLAGRSFVVPCPAGADVDLHAEQCAKAAFLFDKLSKNFLLRCWRARQNIIGKITVSQGQIVHERPALFALRDPVARPFVFHARSRWEWTSWIPRDPTFVARRQGLPKGFFVVLRGRTRGVFYRWCDAFASVAGFPDAKFKGFDSKADAYAAWQRGRFD